MGSIWSRVKRIELPKGAILEAEGTRWVHEGGGVFTIVGAVPTMLEYLPGADGAAVPAPAMETVELDGAPRRRRVWFLPFEKDDLEHNRLLGKAGEGWEKAAPDSDT